MAPARGDPVLRKLLEGEGKTVTPISHAHTGIEVNRLQFLYMRYGWHGGPTEKRAPTGKALARLLAESGFQWAENDAITTGKLDRLLADTRRDIKTALSKAARDGELDITERWVAKALLRPSRYERGRLFAPLQAKKPKARSVPRKPKALFDEGELTKGQLRKLNALRMAVGPGIGERAFAQWLKKASTERAAEGKNITLITEAVEALIKEKKLNIARGGYLLKRGRGRIIVTRAAAE